MRKKYVFGKKLYISILTSILVMLTTVATTFAWIGVFANSTFDTFDVQLKSSNLDEYGIEISLTGEEDSFSNTISGEALKKQILLNWGYTEENISQVDYLDLFNTLNMEQCTTIPNVSNDSVVSLGDFTNLLGESTKSYFKFDVYVSAVRFYEKPNSFTDFKLDVYLNEGLIKGNERSKLLVNPFTYPTGFFNPLNDESFDEYITPVQGGTRITRAKVNSKSVCRVAFEKYEVVEKYHPEQYGTASTPVSTVIYSGDSYNYPTYNESKELYEFGGILEDDLNLAVGYYNSTEWLYTLSGIKSVSVPSEILNTRGVGAQTADKLFNSTTNHIIDSSNANERIGINDMMKITVSFWIEGWDSDCFNAIGNSPVTLSISLSITNEEEF